MCPVLVVILEQDERTIAHSAMQGALVDFQPQLEGDPVVRRHLQDLFKALLEQNLIRIIQPYSKVEVAHIAQLIKLDTPTVERELSQMILDKKIEGATAQRDNQ